MSQAIKAPAATNNNKSTNPIQQLTNRILHEILEACNDEELKKQVIERIITPSLKTWYVYLMIAFGFLIAIMVMISLTLVMTFLLYMGVSNAKRL
jgi:hypothetical protein